MGVKDFYQWALDMSKETNNPELAEFMESVGKSQLRELRSRLRVLVMHMLKYDYQPEKRTTSWVITIDEQRDEISSLLEESPSLKRQVEPLLQDVYLVARKRASDETGLSLETFPEVMPYSLDQVVY